jgi:N-acetylglutamate synthase-like GNAT family acetyltransferase
MSISVLRGYPRSLPFNASTVVIRLMTAADGPALSTFVQTLSSRDLLFVRRDISHPKVIAAWLQALEQSNITSLVAYDGDELVGCTAIVTDTLSWSRHVGEMRVLVAPAWRGCRLGRALIQECFALGIELGLEKLTVQMTVDQLAAITVFEELGFHAEAVLHNHVKDHEGNAYDLALLSHDVAEVQALMEALGVPEALNRQR